MHINSKVNLYKPLLISSITFSVHFCTECLRDPVEQRISKVDLKQIQNNACKLLKIKFMNSTKITTLEHSLTGAVLLQTQNKKYCKFEEFTKLQKELNNRTIQHLYFAVKCND